MIDTIALTMKQNEFSITDWRKFQKTVIGGKNTYTKYVYNPNIKLEGYKPRLTIYDRFGTKTARIEFSAPKLLLGNNFDELSEKDFEPLVQRLTSDLRSMSFQVYQCNLRNVEVSKIDYSKNIIFTDFITSSMLITELSKVDMSAKLDETLKNFRNDGHLLTYHANSYEICFYDKRKDLEQAKKYGDKRSVEKDNIVQLNLFDNLKSDPLEILRLEYRLNDRRQMKKLFSKFGIETDLKFSSLFKKDLSKKLLLNVWQLFESDLALTTQDTDDPISLLDGIFKEKPDISLLKALAYAMSYNIASSGNGGIKKFKDCIIRHSDMRSWYRIKSQLKGVGLSPTKTKLEALMQISRQLNKFEPVKLKDYPQLQAVDM